MRKESESEKINRRKEPNNIYDMTKNDSKGITAGILIIIIFFVAIAVPLLDITVIDAKFSSTPPYIQGNFYSTKVPAAQYLTLINPKPDFAGDKNLAITVYDKNRNKVASYYFFVYSNQGYEFKIPQKTDDNSMIGLKLPGYEEYTIAHFTVVKGA